MSDKKNDQQRVEISKKIIIENYFIQNLIVNQKIIIKTNKVSTNIHSTRLKLHSEN